ncbi:unnamed protein product [Cercopithifilaria johnstoni]|uniref:Uncharacterized protein n=1 Tax=Cercopithifilaria johnstoni TaxID=2874296 RepID=A0A8J2MNQ4_9BILA|nr:unnamed protein product [Cercopithifilaria johnstoni]
MQLHAFPANSDYIGVISEGGAIGTTSGYPTCATISYGHRPGPLKCEKACKPEQHLQCSTSSAEDREQSASGAPGSCSCYRKHKKPSLSYDILTSPSYESQGGSSCSLTVSSCSVWLAQLSFIGSSVVDC